jgi:hypothetical protein
VTHTIGAFSRLQRLGREDNVHHEDVEVAPATNGIHTGCRLELRRVVAIGDDPAQDRQSRFRLRFPVAGRYSRTSRAAKCERVEWLPASGNESLSVLFGWKNKLTSLYLVV